MKKKLIVLFCIFLSLALITLYLKNKDKAIQNTLKIKVSDFFKIKKAEDIVSIEVKSNKTKLEFEKNKNNNWEFKNKKYIKISDNQIKDIVKKVYGITSIEVISHNKENQKNYGIDTSTFSITFFDGKNKDELIIGKMENYYSKLNYITKKNDNNVYLVNQSLQYFSYRLTERNIMNKKLLTLNFPVKKINIKSVDNKLNFESTKMDNKDSYTVKVNNKSYILNTQKIKTFFNKFNSLSVTDYLKTMPEKDLAVKYTFNIVDNKKSLDGTIYSFKKDYLVKFKEDKYIYKINKIPSLDFSKLPEKF